MMAVIVVSADGRQRTNLTVYPVTKFADIVKEAAQRFNLDHCEYRLKHKRQFLDPSCQVRFSSLPPNAVLELHASNNIAPTTVTACLDLVDGRLSGDFPSTLYISQALQGFETAAPQRFRLVRQNPKSHKLQLPELSIAGRRYLVDEWMGMRMDEVCSDGQVALRISYSDTDKSLMDIERMLAHPAASSVFLQSVPREVSPCLPEDVFLPADDDQDPFEPSPELLRAMVADARNRTKRLMDAPLLSKRAVDEKRVKDLLASHPQTTIRFRLADRRVLDATFDSADLGESLYTHISQYGHYGLVHAGRLVDRARRLCDQGLVPNAVVTVHKVT